MLNTKTQGNLYNSTNYDVEQRFLLIADLICLWLIQHPTINNDERFKKKLVKIHAELLDLWVKIPNSKI